MSTSNVTICLTSYKRFDLLERTVTSLLQFWYDVPPYEFIIHEDSGSVPMEFRRLLDQSVFEEWKIKPIWLFSENVGQVLAIDKMYKLVETDYIFHCEDDWEFDFGGFVQASKDVLKANASIACVWLRYPADRNGHPVIGHPLSTPKKTKYMLLKVGYRSTWHGFTWNPGLRRLKDYKEIGAFSTFTEFKLNNPIKSEMDANAKYLEHGFRAASLLRGFVRHIGGRNSTSKFKK
jgi:hypothetical protein